MAYNKTFNPDALPAHAEPDQAAQALSNLTISQQKPPAQAAQPTKHPSREALPGGQWHSPAAVAAQQSYRPHPVQTNPQHQHYQQYGYQNQNPPQDHRSVLSPPPPSGYGHGPRPQAQPIPPTQRPRPLSSVQQPPQPLPVPGADGDLYPLFRRANVSDTGSLTASELGSALVNADFTPFDPRTIRSLMRMFSTSPPSQPQGPTINFTEFQNLWRFLAAWRELFERFDEDGSGKISLDEFSKALVAFGYRLSQPFVNLVYTTYNERIGERRGSRGGSSGMSFDLFVQACVSLKRMTDVFKKYDDDMDGYVTVSFEEFLSEILKLRDP